MASGIAQQRVRARPYPRDKVRGPAIERFLGEAAPLQICCAQKFRGQLYVHGFHRLKLPHKRQFVMRYPSRVSVHQDG